MQRVRDEYERLAALGSGGAGIVFAARHRASGQKVAIKTLLPHATAGMRERFLREAQVRIDSPFVVQVHDVREEGEQIYLILDLVEGGSLQDLLRSEGAQPIPEVARLGEQVAMALQAIHDAGILHRDVKPANVLLTVDRQVRLGDFGLAKDAGSILTATGQGMGTLAYMAPEQAVDAKRVEASADVYGLGATLYHLLSGRPPIDPHQPGFASAVFDAVPTPLLELRPDCPPALAALVARMLEKDPHDRPPRAASVAKRLRKLR